MLNLQPHLTRDCEGVSRRSFLQVGGLAGFGLTLPTFLARRAQAAKAGVNAFIRGAAFELAQDQPRRLRHQRTRFGERRGEQSRLRWVEVTHQADWIGKLCAFLAPYSLPAREGNQKQ